MFTPVMQLYPALTFALGMTVVVALPPVNQGEASNHPTPGRLTEMVLADNHENDGDPVMAHLTLSVVEMLKADVGTCAHLVRISETDAAECDRAATQLATLPGVGDPARGVVPPLGIDSVAEVDSLLKAYCRARWANAVSFDQPFDETSCVSLDGQVET